MFRLNIGSNGRSIRLAMCSVVLPFLMGVSIAHADVCEDTISYNQTKTFFVAPAGSLEVCYFPNGQGTVEVGGKISLWEFWISQDPPTVTVNVFWGASSEATDFTYLATIDATIWWRYAPPLYLQQGVYVVSIITSALAGVSLNVKPN